MFFNPVKTFLVKTRIAIDVIVAPTETTTTNPRPLIFKASPISIIGRPEGAKTRGFLSLDYSGFGFVEKKRS